MSPHKIEADEQLSIVSESPISVAVSADGHSTESGSDIETLALNSVSEDQSTLPPAELPAESPTESPTDSTELHIEPAHAVSEDPLPAPGLFELRTTESMGSGLFATRDIPRGTRIISDSPTISVSRVEYESLMHSIDMSAISSEAGMASAFNKASDTAEALEFCKNLSTLPEDTPQKISALHCGDAQLKRATTNAKPAIRKWLTDNTDLAGKKRQDAVKATTKRFAIYHSNRVQLGNGGKLGFGLFANYSRLNHSCSPNAHHSYNPTIGRLTVHATRDIKKDEQLFANYIGPLCRPKEERAKIIGPSWGFDCRCGACTNPGIDEFRRQMSMLDGAVSASYNPSAGISKQAALQAAECLVALMEQQNLQGIELCKTYRDCSRYSLQLGQTSKALKYARQELEMEQSLFGTDTEHFRENLYGAKYWLEDLEKKAGIKA